MRQLVSPCKGVGEGVKKGSVVILAQGQSLDAHRPSLPLRYLPGRAVSGCDWL